MRELVIGDVHGCLGALEALLARVKPGPDDTLVFLGDMIDRGPDSCGVIEAILALEQRCTVVPLVGNHEIMLLAAREDREMLTEWLRHGGTDTLDSYRRRSRPGVVGFEMIPQRHWDFYARTLNYWETEDRIFVHASLDPELELGEQPEDLLFWEQFVDPTVHISGKEILCGHTSQRSGLPAIFEGGVCIDTYAYGGGWLTCFETNGRMFTQANEAGQVREFGEGILLR